MGLVFADGQGRPSVIPQLHKNRKDSVCRASCGRCPFPFLRSQCRRASAGFRRRSKPSQSQETEDASEKNVTVTRKETYDIKVTASNGTVTAPASALVGSTVKLTLSVSGSGIMRR